MQIDATEKFEEEAQGKTDLTGMEIAVVGLAGRFPGAENIKQFWRNLREGVESISFFSEEEVLEAGANEALVANPNYVRARGILGNIDRFDATFFGYSPGEAALMDPQHRIFLETAWQALEDASYCSKQYAGKIGVYASVGFNSYLVLNMEVAPDFIHAEHGPQAMLGNDKDFIASRVSYKLKLTGPSVVVQSACSSSLMAIHQACQGLLSGEADMQLAGGITIRVPEKTGNLYQEGMINSPDGHCRAFDKDAAGTVAGNGVGVVVLKRLEDALEDRDHIYAVIKASAVNNDGDDKVGYTAPSPRGQAKVIEEAQTLADVPVESIAYVEAHGSGTKMGDPIEIEALRTAFRKKTEKKAFCAVGSVKSNIGHLDAAAGVAGFIKSVLALHHKKIPPSVNFSEENPLCHFPDSPFYVNTECLDWPKSADKCRAGVSSFGMGGTNVHIILEEAPERSPSGPARDWQLVSVSAKTVSALDRVKDRLREDLKAYQEQPLADLAFSLHKGRSQFPHSSIVLARDSEEALEAISQGHHEHYFNHVWDDKERLMTFMFSGQGSQHVDMARALYEREAEFQQDFNYCASILNRYMEKSITDIIFPDEKMREQAKERLNQTAYTQPALFTVEYCIAKQLMRWGIHPAALIGHSVGEYVAACIAGIFSLEDALKVVAERGRLIQSLPEGDMLFVPKAEAEIREYLNDEVSLAVVNTFEATVLSGSKQAIAKLRDQLEEQNIKTKILRTSHAFHSNMMEPILEDFKRTVCSVRLGEPMLPVISNISGDWLTKEQAADPQYWVDHLRSTVRFANGIEKLTKGATRLFLEIGPGNALTQFTRAILGAKSPFVALASQPSVNESVDAQFALLRVLGRLWQQNFEVDWDAFYKGQRRNRLPLSVYPFQGDSYWVNFGNKKPAQLPNGHGARDRRELLWAPTWEKQQVTSGSPFYAPQVLLVTDTATRFGVEDIFSTHYEAFCVAEITEVTQENFVQILSAQGLDLAQALDLFIYPSEIKSSKQVYELIGFLRNLANVVSHTGATVNLGLILHSAFDVFGDETREPALDQVLGAMQLIANLLPNLNWRVVDLGPETEGALAKLGNMGRLEHESISVVRNNAVWQRRLKVYPLPERGIPPEKVDIYLCLGEPNIFITQLVTAWHNISGGTFIFALPRVAPETEWQNLSREGRTRYRYLLEMREAGVPVRLMECDITEASALGDLVVDLAEKAKLALLDLSALGDREKEDFDFFSFSESELERLNRLAAIQTALLSLEQEGKLTWYRRLDYQSSLLAYPQAVKPILLAARANILGRLIYINDDFFENNLYQDWMQRVSHEQRVEQLLKAIMVPCQNDFVWLNPCTPEDWKWCGSISTPGSTGGQESEKADENSGLYKRPELSVPYAAPITERQKIISAIWTDLFHVEKVGIHDDFFELGGDSVMALKLLSALELAFNVALPLSEVINSPNVAAQANAIVEYTELPMDQRQVSPLVTLQGKGNKPPFFCVHPAGGIIHCYIEMSRILGKEQPFYAFQHPGIDGKSGPYVTYPKMAELYVDSLLEIQPEGPYFLGGWSFGGTVAYEMALQLMARGKEVAMLALFDSPGPSSLYRLKGRPEFEFAGMLAFLSQALGTMFGADIQVSVDEMRKIPPERQLDYILERAVEVSGDTELGNAKEALERIVDIFEVCDVGERDYEPGRYPQNIHMYRVQDLDDYEFTGYKEHPQLESATFGWEELCDAEVLVRFVPGTHISMIFPPNVRILTEKFKADIESTIAEIMEREEQSSAPGKKGEGSICVQ